MDTPLSWAVRQRYHAQARSLLDAGQHGSARLLIVSRHRAGPFWARRTVGFRAIVADSGLYARSGVQPSPLGAVEAALRNLYHPTTV
jgi:hypothetical protein